MIRFEPRVTDRPRLRSARRRKNPSGHTEPSPRPGFASESTCEQLKGEKGKAARETRESRLVLEYKVFELSNSLSTVSCVSSDYPPRGVRSGIFFPFGSR
jgi:hypothetical protein